MDAANTKLRNALDQAQEIRADRIRQAERLIEDRRRGLTEAIQHKEWWANAIPADILDCVAEERRRHLVHDEAKGEALVLARAQEERYTRHLKEQTAERIGAALFIATVLVSLIAGFFLSGREAGIASGAMSLCLVIALLFGRGT